MDERWTPERTYLAGEATENVNGNVYPLEESPLGSVPFHTDIDCVRRLAPAFFPVHVAVHQVTGASLPGAYTLPHTHAHPEINLILGETLVYDISIGDKLHRVYGQAAVWIPANEIHAANVVRGSGTYVCIILAPHENTR